MLDVFMKFIGKTAVAVPLSIAGLSVADIQSEYSDIASQIAPPPTTQSSDPSNYHLAQGQHDLEELKKLASDEASKILLSGDISAYQQAVHDDPFLKLIIEQP